MYTRIKIEAASTARKARSVVSLATEGDTEALAIKYVYAPLPLNIADSIEGTLSEFTTLLVNRVIVCVVVPDCTSTTCTAIVGTLDVGVVVAVGEATGVDVPLPTVAVGVVFGCVVAVAAGVLVAFAVAVAAGVLVPFTAAVAVGPCCIEVVGMTAGVAVTLERSIVLGILFSTVRISLAVGGVVPCLKFVMLSTLTFLLLMFRSTTCTVS